MKRTTAVLGLVVTLAAIKLTSGADWPQWRGPNRDAKATGFKAPATWPQTLSQKWKVTVGLGDATPSLVGNRLYVFSRQEGNEVISALDAESGNELWQDKYESGPATGAASGHSGPRASPTVVDGKVVTLGVRGTLSCLDAATGKLLWRKNDYEGVWPRFFTSSSPIVVDGLCIAQVGGPNNGGIVAYDLVTGNERWKWTGDTPAYASPELTTIDGEKLIVALNAGKIVALAPAMGNSPGRVHWAEDRADEADPLDLAIVVVRRRVSAPVKQAIKKLRKEPIKKSPSRERRRPVKNRENKAEVVVADEEWGAEAAATTPRRRSSMVKPSTTRAPAAVSRP